MPRRTVWQLLPIIALISALLACSQQPPPTPQPGDTPTGAAKTTPASQLGAATTPSAPASPAPQTAASPAAATKAASPVAAPRVAPQGRATFAWHTALSPVWLDPQEYPAGTYTPFIFGYFLHDALVKAMPGNPYTPSLAESYEIAPDFRSATFTLRQGVKFQNGDPVSTEDVKFSFENYRGGNARALKEKVDRIETPDDRTVRFIFKEPFLDFLLMYGGPVTAAGWIVPKKYYEQVGPDGFKQRPIGAGPYQLVRQVEGSEFEFEAFTDYWRKSPSIKTFVVKGIAEGTTRVATFQTGEADFASLIPGQLWNVIKEDSRFTPAPTQSSSIWIEFAGFDQPGSQFADKRVREAVSLVLDRQAISEAEEGGLSGRQGNWIPENWPNAIQWPPPEYDPARAKQLMAEAGYPNGFDVEALTPFPPNFSLAERVATALREIGIRTRVNQMERAAYTARLSEGPEQFKGHILIHFSASPGDAASWIRAWATCGGSSSRMCVPEIDQRLQAYDQSTDLRERERLVTEIQQYMLENWIFVEIYRQALLNAQGPRIANQWDEIFGAVPGHPLFAPIEDVRLKDGS